METPPACFALGTVILEPSHYAVRRPKPCGKATRRGLNSQSSVKILSNSQNQPSVMKVYMPLDDFNPQHSTNPH